MSVKWIWTFSVVSIFLLSSVSGIQFQQTRYNVGGLLNTPTSMEFAPDGRLFVAEKSGNLRVILPNGTLLSTPFASIGVLTSGERGLLGITFDPNFASNRYLYIYYTSNTNPAMNRVSRITASATNPNLMQSGSEVVLLSSIPSAAGYHNGGAIHFGIDGKLYIAIGEGHNANDAQSLNIISGKILRINPDGTIPTDNPFFNTAIGFNRSIWAYGLRNPFTFAIDPLSGKIHINDVGQSTWEEVNLGAAGANYGWPVCEGMLSAGSPCPAQYTKPLYVYDHSVGIAITGGTFYRGTHFTNAYDGAYFFGDYSATWIKVMYTNGSVTNFITDAASPIDFKVGSDGRLYYLSIYDGIVYRISVVGGNSIPTASMSATPTLGAPPLNVAFSASGSNDPDGDALSYSWNFGDGGSATGLTTNHLYTSSGRYDATVTVNDGRGGSAQATRSISVGTPPSVVITSPSAQTLFNAADNITFRGNASDVQEGYLSAQHYTWNIELHHDNHSHPFYGPTSNIYSGGFQTAYQFIESSSNIWYRITLNVNNSLGLINSTYVDVIPRRSNLTFVSGVAGILLELDGQPSQTPYMVTSVARYQRGINAPSPQYVQGTPYLFTSWNDGLAQNHTIVTPLANTIYNASFTPLHPADSTLDRNISASEFTTYNLYYKQSLIPPLGTRPPTSSQFSRAVLLFKLGGPYHFEAARSCPLCWVNGSN